MGAKVQFSPALVSIELVAGHSGSPVTVSHHHGCCLKMTHICDPQDPVAIYKPLSTQKPMHQRSHQLYSQWCKVYQRMGCWVSRMGCCGGTLEIKDFPSLCMTLGSISITSEKHRPKQQKSYCEMWHAHMTEHSSALERLERGSIQLTWMNLGNTLRA